MATFIIKNSSGSSRIDNATITGSSVVLGSREDVETELAAITVEIRDGALAPQHCVIRANEDGTYWVEEVGDRSTASGTFVDEELIEGPTQLSDGSTLTLGSSRFRVSIKPEKQSITLEYRFFQKDHSRDPIRWTQEETKLGRYAPVRWGNWSTLVVIVLGLAYLLLRDGEGDRLFSPGPLRHDLRISQAVAGYGGLDHAPGRLRDAVRQFAETGCEACHVVAGERVAFTTCTSADCHDDMDAATRHPRGKWSDRDEPSLPDGIVAAYTCTDCHTEHRDRILPRVEDTADTCTDCHRDTPRFEQLVETYRRDVERASRPATAPVVNLTYNTFSHTTHRKVQCGSCHQRPEVAYAGPKRDDSDFKLVTFERCMECHGADRGPEIDAETPVHAVAWHGAREDDGASCLRCHSALYAKELKSVVGPSLARPRRFDVTSRPHRHLDVSTGAEAGETQPCGDCHLRAVELDGGRLLKERRFPHELHVADLASPRDCDDCHAGIARATTLAEGRIYERDLCAKSCHVDESRPERPLVVPARETTVSVTRVDFPHESHLDRDRELLNGGCAACHVLDGSDPATPVTAPEVKNCSSCHDASHKTIAGGSCHACHPSDASGAAAVYANRTVEWARNGSPGFDHYSSGHAAETARDCSTCHGAMIDSNEPIDTIDAVQLPVESDRVCLNCHVGSRFHMPLPARSDRDQR